MINNNHALLILLCLLASPAFAETIKLPVVQDNSIVMVNGEWEVNAGKSSRIRIKGNQHIVAMSFDLSAIRGKKVIRAELVCPASAETISGVTISTIAAKWDETKSNGLTAGIGDVDGWGFEGGRFPAVIGGNAFTLVNHTKTVNRDGVYHWEVSPDMVHAMSIGIAHGLAIHEHDADYKRNPTIFSREQSAKQPYLVVEVEEKNKDKIELVPPTELKLTPVDASRAQLTVTAPAIGFAYEVTVDGYRLGQHNVPLLIPKQKQTVWLRELPDSSTKSGVHEIAIVAVSRTGERSKPASIRGELFGASHIKTPEVNFPPAVEKPVRDLSVIPVTDKYDRDGKPVGELPADYRKHNSLFDGKTVRLNAAAGEIVGLQVLLRGKGDVSLSTKLDGDASAWRIDSFQAVYVPADERQIPDPLLPLPKTIQLSPNKDESIFADIFVPFDARPGLRRGTIAVSDGREIPIELTVLPIQLPKKASFLCEMNSYGLPDHVDDYYALQQVAYDHRVHANILHYSHHTAAPGARKSNLDMRLRNGKRMDNKRYDSIEPGAKTAHWDDFVAAFGPFLDGSCFSDGHRGPIAAPGFYLTFHESWPLNCRAYFEGNPDAYRAFAKQPVYAETYVNVLNDFVRLAKQQGWNKAGFQVYFNNKGSLDEKTKAPWILDEPSAHWDYRALQYYGELTDKGRRDAGNLSIDYRIDISRPEYCRGQLRGRSDHWVVSSSAIQNYRRLVTDRMKRDGLKVWVYGTSNHVHQSNRQVQAWALDAWQHGATGVVPWQTVDKTGKALSQADQLGLFIFDRDQSEKTVVRHSIRLKAYRDVEQLIEYLHLVQKKLGWTRGQMREFVKHYAPLSGSVRKRNEADAGTSAYDSGKLLGIDSVRRAAIELLK